MHHLYVSNPKGDALCPLGFHPQVRWPTRCKRCFRDYKEHGGKKKDDDFTSTPSLNSWNSPASRSRDDDGSAERERGGRSWSSSQNLSTHDAKKDRTDALNTGFTKTSASWTSTPDLNEGAAVTVSLKLPSRRSTGPLPSLDTGQSANNHAESSATVTLRRPSASPPPPSLTISKNDSLAERVRKMQLLKAHNSGSFEKEGSFDRDRDKRSSSRSKEEEKPLKQKDDKTFRHKEEEKPVKQKEEKTFRYKEEEKATKDDLIFLTQVKSTRKGGPSKPPLRGGPTKDKEDVSDDDVSTAGTATTDTTLVDDNVREYQEQIDSLKDEVDTLRKRCERVEKEKSDILLRRLANIDTTSSKLSGRSSEVIKLQQKVNDLTSQNEDLRDEKKSLSLKVKEMEAEIEAKPSAEAQAKQIEQLRAKLLAAETLCEELMDENEDMKKELKDLEEEIEEMQDNFREDQADEYSSLRRELEQTTKNCRVLSFKLKKTERKVEQLEQEKAEQEKKLIELAGGKEGLDRVARIKELEKELTRSNEVALRLQRELQEANAKTQQPANQRRNPSLGVIGKTPSSEGKVSRASLTRGGSQEDPQQLLRDLQDSLEREADLREQLKNAEEEANNLRKTAARVEDDNESLLLQLKKMATKARTRKLSPTPPANRLSIEVPIEKDEGISDEEDPAELRILLELNEQESAVLRRKVEELEQDRESLKRQIKDLTDKIAATPKTGTTTIAPNVKKVSKSANLAEEKVKILEDEIAELRKKLIEKDRDVERLHAELSLAQKKTKGSLIKSKSLDSSNDPVNVDLKRQLQVIEQEANVLRSKTQALDVDNEKLAAENKKLQLLRNTKSLKSDKSIELATEKVIKLEKELKDALAKVKEYENREKEEKPEKKVRFESELTKKDTDNKTKDELEKLKIVHSRLEKDNARLQTTLRDLKDNALKSFKPRVPKKITDLTTKLQMKKMVEELESEIGEMYVIMKNAKVGGAVTNTNGKLEKEMEEVKSKLHKSETELSNEKNRLQAEISELVEFNCKLESEKNLVAEQAKKHEEEKYEAIQEVKSLKDDKNKLEAQINKLNTDLKLASSKQIMTSDLQRKIDDLKNQMDEKDKEIEKLKKQNQQIAKLEEDKNKLIKEVGDKTKKILDLEKRLKETEDNFKRTEKQLTVRKERVSKLEKQEETLRETSNQKYDEAVSSVEMAQIKEDLAKATKELEHKEKELSQAKQDVIKYTKELTEANLQLTSIKSDMSKLETDKKEAENNVKVYKKDATYWESKASEFETDLMAERKKLERMRAAHDKDTKNKEAELATLKGKLKILEQSSGSGAKKITELKQDYEEKVKKLEHQLAVEKAEYEELTGKYEMLEEEHVMIKAKLTMEKETVQSELLQVQRELSATSSELKTIQEAYDTDSEAWDKEKADLETEMANLQDRLCGGGWEVEKARLTAKLDQKEAELKSATSQRDMALHQQEALKREVEDARQKLNDFERVNKMQKGLSSENAELSRDLATLRKDLENAERVKKNELAECKIRYDGQMQSIQDELKSLQNQVSRFKRERDNYKQMLEAAQKQMQDLKSGDKTARSKRASVSSTDDEELRSKMLVLEQQIACLEDELCESRLHASKLNTELVSERSTAEVRLAEMQSKLNEYEEERLLSSGRARVAGLATRMELAWHKEREEQQRLLQETSTLARDLRQTLFEVERERDKERLDMKRRIEQLKKTTEEETEEAKKKVTELQCDLLELRDAHAKLRTTNEKLRRDKERHDKDREQNRLLVGSLKRAQLEDDRKITFLLETLDELMKQKPEVFKVAPKPEARSLMTPTPPRRNRSSKSRSREATPEEVAESAAAATVARLQRLADEIKSSRIAERQRRQLNAKRAASTEPRDQMTVTPSRSHNGRAPPLSKRSLSLEQTTKDQNSIWKSVDEESVASSIQSLESDIDNRIFTMQRDTSLDSRLSGGSTQSEVLPGEGKKKKKGFLGKLKKLTKSRSIDDNPGPEVVEFRPIGTVSQGSDSDMSAAGSKRDLRGRLSDIFKSKGQLSRGNSKEESREVSTPTREGGAGGSGGSGGYSTGTLPPAVPAHATPSLQRPLTRNANSALNLRPSPTPPRSDASVSSRAASATPGPKRKGK